VGRVPGYIWRIRSGRPEPWVEIPDAVFMNGCTPHLDGRTLLVCESVTGRIFAVDQKEKRMRCAPRNRDSRVRDYFIAYRFADEIRLRAWESSPERRTLVERIDPLTIGGRRHESNGLEAWFDLPPGQLPPPAASDGVCDVAWDRAAGKFGTLAIGAIFVGTSILTPHCCPERTDCAGHDLCRHASTRSSQSLCYMLMRSGRTCPLDIAVRQ